MAAPFSSITGVPAAMSTPATVVERRASRKSDFTGLSMRSDSSMKSGIRSGCARSSSCSSGYSQRYFRPTASRRAVVSWPAANRNVAVRTTEVDVGRGPVGVGAQGQTRQRVVAGLAPTVLDVLANQSSSHVERVEADVPVASDLARLRTQPEALAEALVVGFGHAEDVGDGEHGEGLACRR